MVQETTAVPAVQIDTSELALNPADNGSLEDCYHPPEPAEIPAIGHIDLSPVDSGSLEDCHTAPAAAPLPDISHIQLADQDETPQVLIGEHGIGRPKNDISTVDNVLRQHSCSLSVSRKNAWHDRTATDCPPELGCSDMRKEPRASR